MWKIEQVENGPHSYGPGEVCFVVNSQSFIATQRQVGSLMQSVEAFQRGDIGTAKVFFDIAVQLGTDPTPQMDPEWEALADYVAGDDGAGVDPEWDHVAHNEAAIQLGIRR